MDQGLILIVMIVLTLTILAFAFNWINKNFNNYVDEYAECDQEIAGFKETIRTEILKWQSENNLTIVQAHEKLGINSKLLEDITNGKLKELSLDTLTNLLIRTGKKVDITISE